MPTQTLGKVKLTPRGAYDPAATYVPLDIVSYGGGSYCVLKNVTGVTPTGDDVNYQLLAKSGADGKSPQISASKTWLVWDDASGAYADTGKPSRGEKGDTGAAGADGADGKDGANGITPTIGENGNWYLGATDTGKPSRGADGATGATGATGGKGADGKSAYAYAVEGGYTGTEAEFSQKLAAEKYPNPNALTFTGAVTGSYDGSAALTVEIPSGGSGGPAEPGYKEAVTLLDVTLDDTTGGLKNYEYDVSGIEKTDVIIINILFPENYSGQITIKNQYGKELTREFPFSAKGMVIGLKVMNGRYMHSCACSDNIAARIDAPLSLFYGQLNGVSGFERPKATDTITKLKFSLTTEFVSGTRIRAYRW